MDDFNWDDNQQRGPNQRPRTEWEEQGCEAPLHEAIDTITGRFNGGGASSSTRKQHLQVVQLENVVVSSSWMRMPPITFTDDPMVITI